MSMVTNKSILAVMKISNIQLSFRYRGQPPFCFVFQEVGHAGRDCPKSRQAHQNTLNNADLSPEDLHHTLNNVKEGDLRVKLNHSKKVGQVPKGVPAASSSPPLLAADLPHMPNKSTNSKTHAPHNNTNDRPSTTNNTNIPNGDQPISTCSKSSSAPLSDTISELKKVFKIPLEMDRTATSVAVASAAAEQGAASICKSASLSSTSKPSEVLRANLSTFKTDVQQPSEMDNIAETGAVANFESLARDTQSATAQSTAFISVTEASDRVFSVKLPGKVVTVTVPRARSFGFSLQHLEFSLSLFIGKFR